MKVLSNLTMALSSSNSTLAYVWRLKRLCPIRREIVLFLIYVNALGGWTHQPGFGVASVSAAPADPISWEIFSRSAVYATQNKRSYMEDRHGIYERIKDTGASLFAVFDGHSGDYTANYARSKLFPDLYYKIYEAKKYNLDLSSMIVKAVLDADRRILEIQRKYNDSSGSTALIAILDGKRLIVANVGDSRAVLCDSKGKTYALSYDHKPDNEEEKARIRENGGFIVHDGVWRVNGDLAVSRSLGDLHLKKNDLVIARPEVLEAEFFIHWPRFFILATDGLWDVMSNEEAVAFINNHFEEEDYGARSLALEACHRGSGDNITVLVVSFQNKAPKYGRS